MDILERLIEIIPANKIFGSGGDYMFLEGVYGAQESVREAISRVLPKRVADKYFTFGQAIDFAKKILYSNPKRIYLGDRPAKAARVF